MPRRRPVEVKISHERWLVSYADFITLLFAFFVVMYSVSQVNESKYRVLSNTLLDAFSTTDHSVEPIQIGQPTLSTSPSVIENLDAATGEMPGDGAFEKTADLPQLTDQFSEQFADLIDDKLVQVNSNEFWLQIELSSSILFESAKAEPSLQARAIFEDVANMLKGFGNPIQVEGYTDNIPIKTPVFPSNWELSTARAAAIVQLLAESGIDPERMAAVGYGEYQPIADNSTEAGRAQNRRVALMIAREKIERPQVKTVMEVEDALESATPDITQPHPQPGLELVEDQAQQPALTEEQLQQQRQAQMEALLEKGGEQTDTALVDILRQSQAGQSAQEQPPQQEGQQPAQVGDIKAVELEGGGLLFSSDPDLPRKQP